MVHQNLAHRGCGQGEEVGAILKRFAVASQLQVRLVDQRGRLQGLPGFPEAPLLAGDAAQFVIHQGHQLRLGVLVPRGPGREQTSDIAGRVHALESALWPSDCVES